MAVVSLRGSSLRQVEVFLDGIPLNPDGGEVVDLSELPPSAFSRVEVWRGDAPASYGAAPLGGVVDLRTPEDGRVPASVGMAAGSWSTRRVWAVGGDRPSPHPSVPEVYVAAEALNTAGDFPYLDDGGTLYNVFDDRMPTRENADLRRGSGLLRLRSGPRSARFTLLDSVAHLDRGLPGPVGARAEDARYRSTRNLLALSVDLAPGGAWRVTPRAWWLTRQDSLDDEAGELGVGATQRQDRSGTLGAQVDARWVPGARWELDALLRARQDRYQPVDRLSDVDAGLRQRNALHLALSGVARGERWAITPAVLLLGRDDRLLGAVPFGVGEVAPDTADLALHAMPRAGALWRAGEGLVLKTNLGRYVRPPDLWELFGAQGGEIGNTSLRPETGVSWDLGGRLTRDLGASPERVSWACLALEAALAEVHATDRILRVQNSQRTTIPINVPAARIRTAELGVELDVRDRLRSRTSLTGNDARNDDPAPAYSGRALPRLPAWELEQRTSLAWRSRVELAHVYSYASATFLDAANILATGERSLHGLSAQIFLPGGLRVAAEARNLLDVRATVVDRNPLSSEDDVPVAQPLADFSGYPLPGRTLSVALSWQPPAPRSPR
jgi:iron complex outermembrane receptor protein